MKYIGAIHPLQSMLPTTECLAALAGRVINEKLKLKITVHKTITFAKFLNILFTEIHNSMLLVPEHLALSI